MNRTCVSRRQVLRGGAGVVGAVAVLAATGSQAAEKVCVDMTQPSSNKGLREALKFTEKAPDPKMSCGTCGFFKPGELPCGSCDIFTGPANTNGWCESWSAKG
jgi:hypothetical protein